MQCNRFCTTFDGMRDCAQKMFLTLFFSGLSPIAPGSIGTLVALPLGFLISYYIAPSTLLLSALLVAAIAVKIINHYEKQGLPHDCKQIVIDELAGVWICIAMVGHNVFSLCLAYVLFRIFDVLKPSVIGKIDREVQGGLGVIGDDLLAGFFAGLLGLILIGIMQKIEALAPLLEFSF